MKKNLLRRLLLTIAMCLTATMTWADIAIDEAHFPDPGFRQWMLHSSFGEDGIITDAEIAELWHFEVGNSDSWTVLSVKGVNYFPNLRELYLPPSVSTVDLTECPNLTELVLFADDESQMTTIDLSPLPLLKRFICVGSHFTSLDLRNNPLLNDLFVWDSVNLTTMDISKCKNLVDVRCDNTALSSVDVSGCSKLERLHCFNCPNLTSINVTGCTELLNLTCYETPIANLDVSTCTKLAEFFCEKTNITRLDLTPNGDMHTLRCTECKLTELILPNSLVWNIQCQDNPDLTTLTIHGNAELGIVNFSNTKVQTVDLTSCKNLNTIVGWNTPLSSLDLTHCPELASIDLAMTKLTTLDLSNCLKLDGVKVDNSQLTSLKLPDSGCNLHTLECSNNQLSVLDLRGCEYLMSLDCHDNQLTSLLLDPHVYPQDYAEYRFELGALSLYNNKLKGAAVDAIANKLLPREYETQFQFCDGSNANEGNSMTPEQVAAFKAKNWFPTIQQYLDPAHPSPDQLVWLDYAGEDPSGISLVKETTDSDASYYSINGIQLTAPRNGVNIIKTAKGTRKVMVK